MKRQALIAFCIAFFVVPAFAESSATSLDFLVYGASGKVGSRIVEEALARGHRVTAVSRDPSRIDGSHPELKVAKGDLLDPESVTALVAGQDIVVVSVRGVVGDSDDPENTVVRIAAQRVVEALRENGEGAGRLVHVGGAGTLELKPGVLLADRLPKVFMPRSLELEVEGQVLVLEYLRGVSDVEWTYVTPPRALTRGKRRGEYRVGGDQELKDKRGKSRISRADFAVAVVDEAENAGFVKKRFSVAY